MTNFFLCDCASIDVHAYPTILVSLLDTNPSAGHVDEFVDLLDGAIEERNGEFVCVWNLSEGLQLRESVMQCIKRALDLIFDRYKDRFIGIVWVPTDTLTEENLGMMKTMGVNQKIAETIPQAKELAKGMLKS